MKLGIAALLGGLAGIAGSFIPWGSPDRLHGVGIPIATALWDAPSGTVIDYPNPWAYIINPVLVSLAACFIFGCAHLTWRISQKIQNEN
jgi:hypothetical protein